MFLGYPIENWLELGQYAIFVLSLFTGIYFISVKLSEFYEHEIEKKEKLSRLKHARVNRTKRFENIYKNVA